MTPDTMFSESQITLMVPNMDEAIRFYTATLGLHLKSRYGDEFAVVEAPGLTIGLHPQPKVPSPNAHAASIGLGVASLETAMEQLKARGVQFVGAIVEDPPIRIANFMGPGGVPLYLCEQSEWR
ncbi:MAG: VOC family protein [Rhizomicrobium sp.]|jgi:catechol 2,3-dioxygenase-like lactoylglutathione lyase family enzyme